MSSSEHLLRATLKLLSSRVAKKFVNTANQISQKAKQTPDQVKAEWELLKEEIINEANRLAEDSQDSTVNKKNPIKSQLKIASIREKMSILTEKFEGNN